MTLGKHETAMLKYVIKYKGLHSIAKDATTQRTAKALQKKGFITINQYGQIMLNRN